LANYTEKLVPELETILSAKTLTGAQTEETTESLEFLPLVHLSNAAQLAALSILSNIQG
jgi:hypothetical protein